jgi:hypothetical protein
VGEGPQPTKKEKEMTNQAAGTQSSDLYVAYRREVQEEMEQVADMTPAEASRVLTHNSDVVRDGFHREMVPELTASKVLQRYAQVHGVSF